MKKTLCCLTLSSLSVISYANSPYFSLKHGDGLKRFSVSVGALHVMPQGKAQPFVLTHRLKKVKLQKLEISKHKRCSTISSQEVASILS